MTDGIAQGIAQGITQGFTKGITQSILELLENLGDIPQELQSKIMREKDFQQLKIWLKLAAKADSIEQFWNNM